MATKAPKNPIAPAAGEGKSPLPTSHIRIARPSLDLDKAEKFYADGLGLKVQFRLDADVKAGHGGLVMLGWPGAAWHLELVHDLKSDTPSPTEEDLLVIYVEDSVDPAVIDRLVAAGGTRVKAANPYWEEWGVTVQDPDGYRLVLCQQVWKNV